MSHRDYLTKEALSLVEAMESHELVTALDCPKFFGLLSHLYNERSSTVVDEIPVQSELAKGYEEAKRTFEDAWKRYLAIEIVKQSIFATNKPSNTDMLATAMVSTESRLCQDIKSKVFPLSEGPKLVESYIDSIIMELLPIAKLLLSGDMQNCKDIIRELKVANKTITEQDSRARDALKSSLEMLSSASCQLKSLSASCDKLSESIRPIAKAYVETFSTYIIAVVESLDLKLQIVEKETLLAVYDQSTLEEFSHAVSASHGILSDLDQAIKKGETNLLLFRQLGPSLESIARQYQQVLSQLSLVKDDLAQLL